MNASSLAAPSLDAIVGALDDEQRQAVLAPGGPLCVVAGAGTGKTRTITHRLAYRVVMGDIKPSSVLAVTFTTRAAGEMRARLASLGVANVQARTFHSAALRQLRFFAPRVLGGRSMPRLTESKIALIKEAAMHCRVELEPSAVKDIASEIEWAKSSLVEPEDYAQASVDASRIPPLSLEQFTQVFSAYEGVKGKAGVIDFEDMLGALVWAIEEHGDVADQVRGQYRHFVVDEYQDVNPLQQRLLDAWLGERDDVCVVGDSCQMIYSFTGASAAYLDGFTQRHRGATVIRLERNYRSTPQVIATANRLIAGTGVQAAPNRLTLRSQQPDGPIPRIAGFDDEEAEARAVARRCRELIAAGIRPSEMAILFRMNSQSAAYEYALARADVPYIVRGSERFFERPEIRQALILLRGAARGDRGEDPVSTVVRDVLASQGFNEADPPPPGTRREKWEALAALVKLAEAYEAEPPKRFVDFVAELTERAEQQYVPAVEGVTIASLHAAKGLEWEAVFIIGMVEGVLPISYATTDEQLEEERRLTYVGVTRARKHLWVSWGAARAAGGRKRQPSRFLSFLR